MFCYKEDFRLSLAVRLCVHKFLDVIGLHDLRCNLLIAYNYSSSNLLCLYTLFRLLSIANYKKYKNYKNHRTTELHAYGNYTTTKLQNCINYKSYKNYRNYTELH